MWYVDKRILIAFMIIFQYQCYFFEGKDLVTNFTAVVATINNIDRGLNL